MRFKIIAALSAFLAAGAVLLAPVATMTSIAKADDAPKDVKGLYLLSDYPAVTVRPGETSTVSLRIQNYNTAPERLALLRECDDIVVSEIKNAGLYTKIWQSFAVLLPVMSVGVMGDMRTYAYTCAVRAVSSEDGMTADWVPLSNEVLKKISTRIVNEVKGVNRVVYDITSKPPGTIEWE